MSFDLDRAAIALGQYAGERNLDPAGREAALRAVFAALESLRDEVPGLRIEPHAEAWPDCARVLCVSAGDTQVCVGLLVSGADSGLVIGTSPARSKTVRPPYNTRTRALWPDSGADALRELVALVVGWLRTADEDARDKVIDR